MMKGKNIFGKFFDAHMSMCFFFLFIIASLVLLFILQCSSFKKFEKYQKTIIDRYEQIIHTTPLETEGQTFDFNRYVKGFSLSPSQSLLFYDYTNSLVQEAVSKAHVEFDANAIVSAKASAKFDETKDLLEMQFIKIQHETESLQIWIGILTLVFLVFSFYSFFKVDEIMRQGRDGLNELIVLKDRGEHKIDMFERKSKDALVKAIADKNELEKSIDNKVKVSSAQFDELINQANVELDKKYLVLADALESLFKQMSENGTNNDNQIFKLVQDRLDHIEEEVSRLGENH